MKPCISQATTMNAAFDADLRAFARGGWTAVELWLTKLEAYLKDHSTQDVRDLVASHGLVAAAAAGQGGLLLSQGAERPLHWSLFRQRLTILKELGVPVLVLAVDHIRNFSAEDYHRAAAALREAASLAGDSGVRLALEFQKTAGFCTSLDTALAVIDQCGSSNVGVCLDLFHFQTGPSKFSDLAYLSRDNLAWVQICDLAGVPRELAGDGDRILPGDGEFPIGQVLDHLGKISYDGFVSLEVLNPRFWQVSANRLADLGFQAVSRSLGSWRAPVPELQGGA